MLKETIDSGFVYFITVNSQPSSYNLVEDDFDNGGDDGVAICCDYNVAKAFINISDAHTYAQSIGMKKDEYKIEGAFLGEDWIQDNLKERLQ